MSHKKQTGQQDFNEVNNFTPGVIVKPDNLKRSMWVFLDAGQFEVKSLTNPRLFARFSTDLKLHFSRTLLGVQIFAEFPLKLH